MIKEGTIEFLFKEVMERFQIKMTSEGALRNAGYWSSAENRQIGKDALSSQGYLCCRLIGSYVLRRFLINEASLANCGPYFLCFWAVIKNIT